MEEWRNGVYLIVVVAQEENPTHPFTPKKMKI